MLKAEIDADVLVAPPKRPIAREDVATLTQTADEYLAEGGRSRV